MSSKVTEKEDPDHNQRHKWRRPREGKVTTYTDSPTQCRIEGNQSCAHLSEGKASPENENYNLADIVCLSLPLENTLTNIG